jgi:hypothetical protein
MKRIDVMKNAFGKSSVDILHKIENIEKDIMDLKRSILNNLVPSKQKIISLKGILKGIEISEREAM